MHHMEGNPLSDMTVRKHSGARFSPARFYGRILLHEQAMAESFVGKSRQDCSALYGKSTHTARITWHEHARHPL